MIKRKPGIHRWIHALFNDEVGQALAEVSLSVPFLLLVLLGAFDLARAAYTGIEVTNAAKAAVQYGSQNSGTAASTSAIQSAAAGDASALSGLRTAVSTSGICSNGDSCTGSGGACLSTDCSTSHIEVILTVDTSASIAPMFPLPGLPDSFTLHGHAVQKILNN